VIEIIWSKSSLQTYNQCPQRFYFEYIAKRPEEQTFDAMERGTIFHSMIEGFYNKIDVEQLKMLPLEEETIRLYFRSLIEYVYDEETHLLYDNFTIIEAARWVKCVKTKGDTAINYFKPVLQEKEIVNEKNDTRGKVDWVFLSFDDEYVIGEIKTGKPYEISEIRKELCFLTLLIKGTGVLPKDPKYIFCYYPKVQEVLFEQPKQQSMNALYRMYAKAVQGLKDKDFHKNIGTLCNYCPYALQCLGEERVAFESFSQMEIEEQVQV